MVVEQPAKVEMVLGAAKAKARCPPVTRIAPLDIVPKEQAFCCLSKFTGKPFPAAARSTSEWPWECCSCGGFCRLYMPFLNLWNRVMKVFECKFVVVATCVKTGFSWSCRRRDTVPEDICASFQADGTFLVHLPPGPTEPSFLGSHCVWDGI